MEIKLKNRKYCGLTVGMMWKYNEALEEIGREKVKNSDTLNTGAIPFTDSADAYEKHKEEGMQPYAIFPKRIYSKVESLPGAKIYNYNFIGSNSFPSKNPKMADLGRSNRAWIFKFFESHFNKNSYLEFTDDDTIKTHTELGEFDYTLKSERPKEDDYSARGLFGQKGYGEGGRGFDGHYYSKMKGSLFTLCPAGDSMYSIRFYEALMCKSIPIVNSIDETFRSPAEEKLDYKYYLTTDDIKYRQDWADHNLGLFMEYHTFDNSGP